MRLNKCNKYFEPLLFTISIVLLSNCNCNIALLNPKGEIAIQQRSLILLAFGLMLIVVIPAIIMAILFACKYRDSNTSDIQYNPNWSHSNKLEAVIWGIPVLIICFLAIVTWKSTHTLDPGKSLDSNKKSLQIEVIALDWKWLFIYPEQKIITINEIAFPVNMPVTFKVTSNSVVNSFFIPELGSQIYAMAGMKNNLNLIANKAGIYKGISSNFSGPGFSGMKFKVIVTKDNTEFNNWIIKVKSSPKKLNTQEEYNKIAIPSQNNPVEYFSTENTTLFLQVIKQFQMSKNRDKP
ncbi:ubiquinol oxidase subunit II [Candidatus Ishikawella capsulata]|uniref:Ubiquinol oxidase subunit 2 n=1 Tax=Candidatus Ishikawaella capsulata Mpkobe TaxID=476281 RepID=C5WCZ4_9ENTR|nr:ubiquinol oxidase subunit II [Candidatus Ishikawaella capsulata]BAH83200.1 cytochrome o ubiquinol oxidase subunit II [Candidatus Ishikawaella capsulata Mpkobe]